MSKTLRVMSMIPAQRYGFADKLSWLEEQIKRERPDVVVTPQEYVGGVQCHFFADKPGMDQKVAYSPDEFLAPFLELSKRYGVGICTGALIDDPDLNERRERIYVIDPEKGVTGHNDKFALPAYDHIDAKGRTRVFPETNLTNRAVAHECMGARIGILFCWEALGHEIWHAISRARPDFVVSMVKFGICGWPQKDKNEHGESIVTGFGFGKDGRWLERLQVAARWDLASPIICSTNSWNLPNKAGAIAGMILPWDEKETVGQWARPARVSTLFNTIACGKGDIQEHVQVDNVDYLYWRLMREHKFTLNAATNEWQSSEVREQTMRWKVERLEAKLVGKPKLVAPKEYVVKAPKGSHKPEPTSVLD